MALPPSTDSAFHSAVTLPSKQYPHLISSRTSVLFSIISFLLLLLLFALIFTSNSYSNKIESALKTRNSQLLISSE